jgi:hypothetical protein
MTGATNRAGISYLSRTRPVVSGVHFVQSWCSVLSTIV